MKYAVTSDGYIQECEVLKVCNNGTIKVLLATSQKESIRVKSEVFDTEGEAQRYIDLTENKAA